MEIVSWRRNRKYISSFLWTFFATTLSLRLLIYKKMRLSKHQSKKLVHVEYFSTCFSKLMLAFRDKIIRNVAVSCTHLNALRTICEMNCLFGFYRRQKFSTLIRCVLFSMWKTLVNEHVLLGKSSDLLHSSSFYPIPGWFNEY